MTAPDYPEVTFFSYNKPLSPLAERTLQFLIERYTDDEGQPLVRFETEDLVTLRIPRVVKHRAFSIESE